MTLKLKRYKLSETQYLDMLQRQDNRCAICREFETRVTKSKKVCSLMVDHDHKTGKVRELLCHRCNTGLGLFRDDLHLLAQAIFYLRSYRS